MPTISYERFEAGLDRRIDKRVADANRLVVLTNAYVTTGRKLRKRPGLIKVAQLETGTKGLAAGPNQLQTFYSGAAPITHANVLFKANQVPSPTGSDLVSIPAALVFNGLVYAAAKYADGSVTHNYLDGTMPPTVTDPNCPNSESIVKAAQKIFGPDNDVVRYCKTDNPRDWTLANDAGFIASGLRADGDPEAQAVSLFRAQLAIMMIDSVQVWNADPNPAFITLQDNVPGVGTRFKKSPVRLATDTYFLAEQGYRSITVAVLNQNVEDVDVGTPIDELVQPTVGTGIDPRSVYSQLYGQFWSIIGNYAWVYSVSRIGKIAAWSRYEFRVSIDDACAFKGNLYLRSGDDVYRVERTAVTDDGLSIPVRIEMAFVDMKLPGVEKRVHGVDGVIRGSASLQFRYNSADEAFITSPVGISEDTMAGPIVPVEVSAVKIAPVVTHEAAEEFELELLTLYYDPLVAR